MKLSAHIIADWLGESVLLSEIDNGDCLFANALLSDLDTGFSPDCIYVSSPREYDVLGGRSAIRIRMGADSIYVGCDDRFSLYQSIMDAFLFYNSWENALKDAVIQNEPFQKMTEIAYLAFRCDVLVFDWRGVILGSMSGNGAEGVGQMLTPYVFKKIQEGEVCRRVAQNIIPSGFVDSEVKASIIALNVYFQDDSFVLFYILSDIPKKNMAHMQLAMFMRSVISYMKPLGRTQEMKPLYYEFVNILCGNEPEEEKLNEIMTFKGWGQDEKFLLYYFNVHSELSLKRNGILHILARKIPLSIVFTHEDHTLMCLPVSAREEAERAIIGILPYFDTSAAVSLPFDDWRELPNALAQAKITMSIITCEAGRLYDCNDYAWQYILQVVHEQCRKINYVSPDVIILKDYDLKHGTELLKTLNVFLRSQSNITLSAELMYIHRNSMKYRMKQISSLISADLKNHEDRQNLLFSSEQLLREVECEYACSDDTEYAKNQMMK